MLFSQFLPRFVQALPLSTFLLMTAVIQPSERAEWVAPYICAAVLALVVVGFLLRRRQSLDILLLGIDGYLVSGAAALLLHIDPVNTLYGELRAVGMLAWMALALVLEWLFWLALSRWGPQSGPRTSAAARSRASALQIAAALVIISLAYAFQDARPYSEVLPFVVLFILRGWLLRASVAEVRVKPTP